MGWTGCCSWTTAPRWQASPRWVRASLPAPLPSTHHKHPGRVPLQRADSPGRWAAFHGKPMQPGSDVPLPAFHPRWAFRARVHPTCTEEKGDCQHHGPGCTGTCSRPCARGRVLFLQGHQCQGVEEGPYWKNWSHYYCQTQSLLLRQRCCNPVAIENRPERFTWFNIQE